MANTRRWLLAVLALSLMCSLGLAESDSADWKTLRAGDLCLRFPADWFDMTPLARVTLLPELVYDTGIEDLELPVAVVHFPPAPYGTPGFVVLLFVYEDSCPRLIAGAGVGLELIERTEGVVAGEPGIYEQYEIDDPEGLAWFAYTHRPRSDGRHVVLFAVSPAESADTQSIIREILLSVAPCPPPPPEPPCIPEAALEVTVEAPQDRLPPLRLLVMLAQVPQEVALISGSWGTVRFVDYAALFHVEGIQPLRMLGSVDLLLTSAPLGRALGRLTAATKPTGLYAFGSTEKKMTSSVGFEWLLDVDRSLEFGEPPRIGLVLDGRFDEEAIGAALQGRGFSLSVVDGVEVWHRFEDLTLNLQARDSFDPFGGALGAAARVAVLPEMLANARSWELIQVIIAASQGQKPSLADDAAYRALAEAITASEGFLVQALFFNPIDLRYVGDPLLPPETQRRLWLMAEEIEPLPTFSLAVLADRQEGDDQVHLIGVVCADPSTAHVACDVLVRRVEVFHLLDRPEETLAEQYGAAIRGWVIEPSENGLAVVLVEARYPLPASRMEPGTERVIPGGPLYRAWVRAIMRREFVPLW